MAKLTPVFIDLETYWSQTHSLSKMNPIVYCTHPETEIISCAVKVGSGQTQVVFGERLVKSFLASQSWDDKLVVGHNMSQFDAMILAWRCGVRPALWGCTLAMARPHHSKTTGLSLAKLVAHYGIGVKDSTALHNTKGRHLRDFTQAEVNAMREYNKADTDQCAELFYKLRALTSNREMKLIDMTIRMLVTPKFRVDVPLLEATLEKEVLRKHEMLLRLANMLGVLEPGMTDDEATEQVKKTLGSAPQFSALLESLGVQVPTKPNTKGVSIPALAKTDEEFVALQEHDDPIVAAAAGARLGVKSTILESRIGTFLNVAAATGGRMPVPINYYGADTTGRDSGAMNLNLQNLTRILPGAPKLTDALRYSLKAPKNHKVVVADLSGIELRVNMFLWKVPYAMALFQADPEKADLYKTLASEVLCIPYDEIVKMQRQAGKAMHLGCFAPTTKVLTCNGIKRIVDVLVTDMVWDGGSWVTHNGVVPQGRKEVQTHSGVTATPDHKILTECGWVDWSAVCGSRRLFQSAIRKGNSPSWPGGAAKTPKSQDTIRGFGARVGGKGLSTATTSRSARQHGATHVPSKLLHSGSRSIGGTRTWFQTMPTARDCLTDFRRLLADATERLTKGATTNCAGSLYARSGAATAQSFSSTSLRSQVGIPLSSIWTVSTMIGGMSREIFGSSVVGITATIDALLRACTPKSKPSKQNSLVYDLADCGPSNRFTIVTDDGPIIVHNCGFGLGSTAKYRAVAKGMAQIDVSEEGATEHIAGYRRKHPEVVQGWKTCHGALPAIYHGAEYQIDPWGLCHTVKGGIKTPQGMILYPDLREEVDENGRREWVYGRGRHKARIYAGKVTENIVQHLAREVVMDNALQVKKEIGINTAHRVHDELVYVVPENIAEVVLDAVQDVMRTPPAWWPELVTWSEGSMGDTYGAAK